METNHDNSVVAIRLEDLQRSSILDDASLEGIYYDVFFRRTGIRTYQKLVAPMFWDIEKFELPKNSIIHYIPDNEVELGIAPTHLFLRKAVAMILAEHLTSYSTDEGAPIKIPKTPQELINSYRKSNRRIRILHKYDTAFRDEKTVAVINYAMLNKLWRYRQTRKTRLFKFNNLMNTFIDKMNALAEITDRQQYIEMTIPKVLPTKVLLTRASLNFNIQLLNAFPDDRSLFLLELWKWLGEDREKSLFSKLTPKAIASFQIVWQESGKYSLMSLGHIDNWRKSEAGGHIAPKQLQLAFLKFLNAVFDIKTATAKTTIESTVSENESGEEEVEVDSITIDGEEMDELLKVEEQAKADLLNETLAEDEFDSELPTEAITYVPREEVDDLPSPPEDPAPLSTPVIERADELLELGLISVPEHRRFTKLANAYETLPDPYGSGKTLGEVIKPNLEVIRGLREDSIVDIKSVTDKSLLKSSLKNFDKDYIEKVMRSDILAAVTSINKAGVAVTDYRIEPRRDANSQFEVHSVKLTPVGGSPSTLTFTMPIVKPNGEFMDRGNKYRMRKQRADLPIRKISSSRVGLTTYYSKLFVDRSERKVDDYGKWLLNNITLLVTDNKITNAGFDNVFNQQLICPRPFSALSTFYTHFDFLDYKFIWDINILNETLGVALVNATLRNGEIPCGQTRDGKTLIMSDSGVIYVNGTNMILGTLEEILGIDASRAPVEIALLDIMGKQIPLGLVLSYYFGFSNLMRKLKVSYRSVVRGSRLDLLPDEFAVKFKDQTIIIPRAEKLAGLVIGSLSAYKNSVIAYDLQEYDRKDVYAPILDMEGLGARYYRELDLLLAMYIDPISEELLQEMGEPTYFPELLLRAAELLTTDHHPDENDARYRRIRGYERMAGHLYGQIVTGLRYYKAGQNNPKAKVDINPRAVQIKIGEDPSVTLVDEINPIQNLKELENLTFGGTGGRSGRTMVRRTRAFHRTELGVVSEATVDSQDVGVTTFLTPNPKLASLRGTIKDWEFDPEETSSLMSTSALLSPGADGDDPKRINFISIQQSHVVAADGYGPSPVRTGYEEVLAQRTGENFSFVASGKGVISESVVGEMVRIEYDDPEKPDDLVRIGHKYGVSGGHVVNHKLVCDLPVGTKVDKGTVVVYNSGFFERSLLDPSQVTWKNGILTTIAFMDTPDTLEDSMAISPETSRLLTMNYPICQTITVRFDQAIRNLVRIGESVEVGSILCNIEDAVTSDESSLDKDVMDSLRMLSMNSPKAELTGTVGAIDVTYHGDFDDMNPALFELVTAADKRRAKRAKLLGEDILNGEVADLDMDTVVIKIYIDGRLGMGDGDKAVLNNQLKTVVRRVMVGENLDGYGKPLGGIFGYTSESDRIVTSAQTIGTANTLVVLNNQRACEAYRKQQRNKGE